jgi:thiamine kinase-like enzyme
VQKFLPLKIKKLFKSIPQLSEFSFNEVNFHQLAGLTNENYLVTITTHPEKKYVLRIPRTPTNEFINRNNESHNAKIAEQLGITPKNLWRNTAGVSLTEYLEDTSTPKLSDSKTLKKVAKTLVTLHNSKATFKGVMDNLNIAKHLKQYFALCPADQQNLLKVDYQKTLLLLETQLCNRPAVPSHIDLLPENILLQDEGLWLIDWEYSAMASPFWDIAIFSNSAELDSASSISLLKQVLDNYQDDDLQCFNHYCFITQTVSECWHSAFQNQK